MTVGFLCPICKKKVDRNSACFPFCSERCKLIDLGNWSDGSYSIAGDQVGVEQAADDEGEEERLH